MLGDKAYISATSATELWQNNRLRLLTLPRCSQKTQPPAALQQQVNAIQQIIEMINSRLTQQFNIEADHARTF